MITKRQTEFGEIQTDQKTGEVLIRVSNFASGWQMTTTLRTVTLVDFGCTLEHVFFLLFDNNELQVLVFSLAEKTLFEVRKLAEDSEVWTRIEMNDAKTSIEEIDRRILSRQQNRDGDWAVCSSAAAHLGITLSDCFLIRNDSKNKKWRIQKVFDARTRESSTKNSVHEKHGFVIKVAAGNDFVVLLDQTGVVYTMGTGSRGELGNSPLEPRCDEPRPVKDLVESDIQIVDIACGGWHTLTLTNESDVYAWGWNHDGQCGVSAEESRMIEIPYPMNLALPAQAIRAGIKSSAVVLTDGTVEKFGKT